MNTAHFDIYHTEMFNFLRTVTIKFLPNKYVLDSHLLNSDYGISQGDVENHNYYYDRLMGIYIPGDTPMYVTSIDTGEQILFSKENLENHPQTKMIYRIPNQEYDLLCQKYPNQVDLIKSIVYPVSDISKLTNSNNISYITGDTSLLQQNEVASIEQGIQHFCTMCQDRWWVKEYCFEEGYAIAFYSLMWQLLPLICFTTRMTNIKTASVHNYHIWEYLCSKGLEDYRDILTIKQALFLYRNMEYILANKGTTGNMFILADNILADFSIALIGKYIYQQQVDRYELCRRTPEIISKQIISYNRSLEPDTKTFETIETINNRMVTKGIEWRNSSTYVSDIERRYGEAEEDRLPTKLLELKKEKISSSYEALLIQFIWDTILYRYSQNKLEYMCTYKDPLTNDVLELNVGDLIAMLYYFSERSCSLDCSPHEVENYFTETVPNRLVEIPHVGFPNNLSEYDTFAPHANILPKNVRETYEICEGDSCKIKFKGYKVDREDPEKKIPIIIPKKNDGIIAPIYIPTKCMVRIPYHLTRPNREDLPEYIYHYHNKYRVDQMVDVDTLLKEIPFDNSLTYSSRNFEDLILKQFTVMVKHIRDVRGSADFCYHRGMWECYHKLCACGNYDIQLSKFTKYTDFFEQNESYSNLFNYYDEANDKRYWDLACYTMFKSLIPITNPAFKQFVGILESMSSLLDKLTSLCIQLFSFRVILLGTDREKDDYLYLIPLVVHHLDRWGTSSGRLGDEYLLRYMQHDATIAFDDGYADLSYFNQKDVTQSYGKIKAISMNMSILEHGISVDNTRTSTTVKYLFDFKESDFEGVLTDGYDE